MHRLEGKDQAPRWPLPGAHPFEGGRLGSFFLNEAAAWATDGFQRSVLFLDLLRQRGNAFFEMEAQEAASVLYFKTEVLMEGRELSPPVNYRLLRILPPDGNEPDPAKRPFIVFDPRAGQGPGIGGMKDDSEIGIALANGHPVYFVSFLVRPIPGQTTEDVCRAQIRFIKAVIARHPHADKPCLIGNCQAGWQVAMTSALNPGLSGVLILAAAPLSYWAGRRGGPMARYAAGLTGGVWVSAFLSDIGGGFFDGAWLVHGFENNSPARAYWKKYYDVYARVDTEGPRYLAFERWWGSPVLLGREEIRFIGEELFIGNRLVTGEVRTKEGERIDLKNIKAPIVVFCSRGDDITPPEQALGWITDLYASAEDIEQSGRTIVYCLHESVGHLGIFVSSRVLGREYRKFIAAIDVIETLPPGLYEAVFIPSEEEGENVMRFERRSIDDVRAYGGLSEEDMRRFKTAARASEIFARAYDLFFSPFVRASGTPQSAALLRALHPVRIPFAFFSDRNPFLFAFAPYAQWVRAARQSVDESNALWRVQEIGAAQLTKAIEVCNQMRNAFLEAAFFFITGLPQVQSALGVRPWGAPKAENKPRLFLSPRTPSLHDVDTGGLNEAVLRALLYALRASTFVDERIYAAFREGRMDGSFLPTVSSATCAAIMQRQQVLLARAENEAVEALPLLLEGVEDEDKKSVLNAILRVISSDGPLSEEERRRMDRLENLFFSK